MSTFEPGDVVQLKSGGLSMTVNFTIEEKGVEHVTCMFSGPSESSFGLFGRETICRDVFDARALVLAPRAKPAEPKEET